MSDSREALITSIVENFTLVSESYGQIYLNMFVLMNEKYDSGEF